MKIDRNFYLDQKVDVVVQTLGFTGVEKSNGQPISIGGVSIETPVANGANSGYWNNLFATTVSQVLSKDPQFDGYVIDVKENTVILLSPSSYGLEKLAITNNKNPAIGMALNAPSGMYGGVWNGENPWSAFVGPTFFSPSTVPVNVYTFGFTSGEKSTGTKIKVAGVEFTTPVANGTNAGTWNSELGRLHAAALDGSDIYKDQVVDVDSNTSILITPRAFADDRITSFSEDSSPIGVSLNMPSGWSGSAWLGESDWSKFYKTPVYKLSPLVASLDEGQTANFKLETIGIKKGEVIQYAISGVSQTDIAGGKLTGLVTIDGDGAASISIPIAADFETELGAETLTVNVQGNSASVRIIDTSYTPAPSYYDLVSNLQVVNEGDIATFKVYTHNVAVGTELTYAISGISAADTQDQALVGTTKVGANLMATISVPIAADQLTEGTETLTISVKDVSASVKINDSSTSKSLGNMYKNSTYFIVQGPSWEQAEARAVSLGGHLVTINDSDENEFVKNFFNANSSLPQAWIGLNDKNQEGSFDWISGEPATYFNWRDGEPNGPSFSDADQVHILRNGYWNDHGNDSWTSVGIAEVAPSLDFSISSSSTSVEEGGYASFSIAAASSWAGKSLSYSISGISPSDIAGGATTGTVLLNQKGKADITIPIAVDKLFEGIETLTLTIEGKSVSLSIIDASHDLKPTFTITPSASLVNEGSTAKFVIGGSGSNAGTTVGYTLSGLNAEDIFGGEVSGRITLDDLGMATVSVPIAADNKTEGSESLTLTVGAATSTITVNDTSKSASQYYISASDGVVEEGRIATFMVSAEDAKPGTKIPYTISGSGITSKDMVNGKLTGTVAIGSDSTATITVSIKEDKLTEGDEDLTVTLTGLGVSETITIEDTSTAAVAVPTYNLEANESSIKEGESAEFQLETTGVSAGIKLKYTISGVSNADLANKKLTGTVEVGEDGSATITIPTASDALTEGTETLTLTVNGQKASVVLLDDNSVKVSETVLEGSEITLYRASLGGHVLAAPGLGAGDALEDFVPLKASAIKDYALPKGLSAVLSYDDGSFGLIIKTGASTKASLSEQKFSEDGIARGKLAKLTTAQVLAKETTAQTDLNGDGVIGEVITEVYDGDGDANQQDYGLYKTSSGAVVLGSADQSKGDTAGSGVTLMANKTKGWLVPSGTSVVGMAITEGGSLEVLTLRGKQYSAQKFDPETGLIKGKPTALKTAQIDAREYYYEIDLTGDGDISLVGQEMIPAGWMA